MSDNAKTLLHWVNAYRFTRIADYDNSYELNAARAWANSIITAVYPVPH